MADFASLVRRADTLRKLEINPLKQEWWIGYIRGLRRAHHGESFGSRGEHEMRLAAAESDNAPRRALGLGYIAGLTLQARQPPEDL